MTDGEFRVRGNTVITLAKILDRKFPVRFDRVVLPMGDLRIRDIIRSVRRIQVSRNRIKTALSSKLMNNMP